MGDRGSCRLFFVLGIEPAALNHESWNNPVENRAVIVLVLDILDEIFNRCGRLVGIDLHHEFANVGREFHLESFARLGKGWGCGKNRARCSESQNNGSPRKG